MKTILILCALLAVVACRPDEYYSTQYDDFDVDELVNNIRLLNSYGKCFLGEGPCTPEGKDFKATIPDALKTKCKKCTPKQRHLIRTVVKAFQSKLPDVWEQLTKQEDPQGIYKEDFTTFLNSTD